LLAGLFTAVGVDSSRAETFAQRIVGWRTKATAGPDANAAGANANAAGADTKDDKAAKEDKLYSEQHMPYPPRHAPFDSALELSLLPGISLAVVERVLPFVTVFSGRAEVDVFSADSTVLSALPQMTPQILGAVLNARVSDPGDGHALLELLGPAKSHATAETSKAFRATIAVDFDNGRRVHAEVVFRLNGEGASDQDAKDQGANDQGTKDQAAKGQAKDKDGAEPYELLYWRDDFDGPMQSA
jgi:general secretion pathway protein K